MDEVVLTFFLKLKEVKGVNKKFNLKVTVKLVYLFYRLYLFELSEIKYVECYPHGKHLTVAFLL